MAPEPTDVLVLDRRIELADLARLLGLFGDMIKYVVDVERGRGRDGCIEFTALINIRPARGNRSMEVEDEAIKERIRALTFTLVGDGEPL